MMPWVKAEGRRPQGSISAYEEDLHGLCALHYANPLGWVRGAFPWGRPGPLEPYREPDIWQCEFLEWLGGDRGGPRRTNREGAAAALWRCVSADART